MVGLIGKTFSTLPVAILVPVTLNIAEQSFNTTNQKSHNLFSQLHAKIENAKSPVKQFLKLCGPVCEAPMYFKLW